MKDTINYYYHFNVGEVEQLGDIYHFVFQEKDYFFVPYNRGERELQELVLVSKELKEKNVGCHDILVNRFGKIITQAYQKDYVLLKPVIDPSKEYDLDEVLNFQKYFILSKEKRKLYRFSWAQLWSKKIDYFEYQIREIGKEKEIILNSFSYYVGLAENAISYVNSTLSNYKMDENDQLCLSHRRIGYPNIALNYLNPISFIFDLEVRDIASFIKSSFFKGENALSYLKEVLRKKRFSIFSLQLLYARLLYPSYYFDIYEEIMNKEEDEEKLIPIIDKSQDYELFLKDAYLEINQYAPIERIEWILNKKS